MKTTLPRRDDHRGLGREQRAALARALVLSALLWPGVGASQFAPFGRESSKKPLPVGFPVSPRQDWGRLVEAPPPPAVLPPLVGSSLPQADGYAPQTADRVGLLGLLLARRFSDLDRCFTYYQEAFEKDFRKEHLPEDAQDAFAIADPRLEPLLDEWVKESPRSFGAWASRGAYRSARNWHFGGFNAVIASVRDAFAQRRQLARADLTRALELRPRAISVFRTLVADNLDDKATSRKWLEASIEVCPDCYRVRRAFFTSLLPRLGGSHEEMQSFTQDVAEKGRSPKLKMFPGLVHWIEAVDEPDPREAMVGYQKAMYFGEHWEFVFYRGICRLRLGDTQEALKDFDRALELRPQIAEILMNRAELLLGNGLPDRAAADLLLALRLDPTFFCPPRVFDGVLRSLFAEAQRRLHDGLPEEALVPMRAVHDLDPAGLAGPRLPLTDANRRVVEACVDTLEDFVRTGWELGERGDNDLAIALWTRYVALHPKSPDGYRYRAVVHIRLGRVADSDADLAQARKLAVEAGRAPRDPARP